jgi:hypothetical protein
MTRLLVGAELDLLAPEHERLTLPEDAGRGCPKDPWPEADRSTAEGR